MHVVQVHAVAAGAVRVVCAAMPKPSHVAGMQLQVPGVRWCSISMVHAMGKGGGWAAVPCEVLGRSCGRRLVRARLHAEVSLFSSPATAAEFARTYALQLAPPTGPLLPICLPLSGAHDQDDTSVML